jgi:catechol 2,3-dioxygenase-like lactoylglutathione lyase family enzyme
MVTIGSLFAVTVDCPDPLRLARFYQDITGWKLFASNEDFVVLAGDDNVRLDFQRVANHQPPSWPDTAAPLRVHLDFRVHDLDQAEAHLLKLGAVRPEFQPGGQRFRVLLDPAGHPFCLATKDAATTPQTPPRTEHSP